MNDLKNHGYGAEFEKAFEQLLNTLPAGKAMKVAHVLPRKHVLDTETGSVTVVMFADKGSDLDRASEVIQKGLAAIEEHSNLYSPVSK